MNTKVTFWSEKWNWNELKLLIRYQFFPLKMVQKILSSGVDFPGFLDSRETGIFPEFSGFPGKFPGKL